MLCHAACDRSNAMGQRIYPSSLDPFEAYVPPQDEMSSGDRDLTAPPPQQDPDDPAYERDCTTEACTFQLVLFHTWAKHVSRAASTACFRNQSLGAPSGEEFIDSVPTSRPTTIM